MKIITEEVQFVSSEIPGHVTIHGNMMDLSESIPIKKPDSPFPNSSIIQSSSVWADGHNSPAPLHTKRLPGFIICT